MQPSEVKLTDTHCHIDFAAFDNDREAVIQRAAERGVSTLIVPAVAQSSWLKTIRICDLFVANSSTTLWLALGLHPLFIEQHQPQHLIELNDLIQQHSPIAVGEIGLDFQLKNANREKQLAYFSKQLIIAKRHQLAVIIHNRKAHDECIKILREFNLSGGIIHAFNGSLQQAEKYIELGFLLGFGGMLTYQRSSKLRSLAKNIALQNIVLETDAPDMTVAQYHGQRNSPEYLPFVLQAVADIKKMPVAEVAAITSANAARVFSLNPAI